jgi:hypothetical protein
MEANDEESYPETSSTGLTIEETVIIINELNSLMQKDEGECSNECWSTICVFIRSPGT